MYLAPFSHLSLEELHRRRSVLLRQKSEIEKILRKAAMHHKEGKNSVTWHVSPLDSPHNDASESQIRWNFSGEWMAVRYCNERIAMYRWSQSEWVEQWTVFESHIIMAVLVDSIVVSGGKFTTLIKQDRRVNITNYPNDCLLRIEETEKEVAIIADASITILCSHTGIILDTITIDERIDRIFNDGASWLALREGKLVEIYMDRFLALVDGELLAARRLTPDLEWLLTVNGIEFQSMVIDIATRVVLWQRSFEFDGFFLTFVTDLLIFYSKDTLSFYKAPYFDKVTHCTIGNQLSIDTWSFPRGNPLMGTVKNALGETKIITMEDLKFENYKL